MNKGEQEEEEKDPKEELVTENLPPLEKHSKITSFFNPMENIVLQKEVWSAEPEDEDDEDDV